MRVIARMNVGGPALQVSRAHARPGSGAVRPSALRRIRRGRTRPTTWICARRTSRRTGCRRSAARCGPRTTSARWSGWSPPCGEFRPHIVHTHTAKAGTLGRPAAVLAAGPGARAHLPRAPAARVLLAGRRPGWSCAPNGRLARLDRPARRGRHPGTRRAARRRRRPAASSTSSCRRAPISARSPTGPRPGARSGCPGEGPVVAYVGRLTGSSGRTGWSRSHARCAGRIPRVRFVVCGGGDLLAEVIEAAARDARRRPAPAGLAGRRRDRLRRRRPGPADLRQRGHAGLAHRGRAGRGARRSRHGSAASPRSSRTASPACSAGTRRRRAGRHTVRLLLDERAAPGDGPARHGHGPRSGSAPTGSSPTCDGPLHVHRRSRAGGRPPARDSETRSPLRVLVTGGAGFIGANLCRELATRPEIGERRRARRPQHRLAPRTSPAPASSWSSGSILDRALLDRTVEPPPTRSSTSPPARPFPGRWPPGRGPTR